ncbi:Na+/H+ antiporter NhaC family protein [Peptoniphilus porci]|uniref:Na+/H+ antiporter NhaC-like C-terminal domain-containing protein n=1 Tax=Peptoniphilus porci TaxID=2652280 RepID=A0A1U7LYE9_9FIRM|nr:Na+/H+ antiporter NhaC family protein [Peptoniphilus porci]OLR64347.1 hypothetical protein BIV18_01690 [Peptoniphilus porci]
MTDKNFNKKTAFISLLPFLVFVGIILGGGIILGTLGYDRPFNQINASVALFIAIIFAIAVYKGSINEKLDSFVKGCADEDIIIMVMTCFLAGAFSFVANAMGGVDSVVNFGLTYIPPRLITPGIFLIAAFMSFAIGSSSGTTAALGVIAFSIGKQAGLNVPIILAAVVSGAFFGDNLSVISDVSIVTARTHKIKPVERVKINAVMAVISAILTAIVYYIIGKPSTIVEIEAGTYSLFNIIPYIVVLMGALAGLSFFVVLTFGILVGGAIGFINGSLNFLTWGEAIFNGFADMLTIVMLAILIGGLSRMMREQGGLKLIMSFIERFIKNKKSAELGMAAIVGLADAAVANNTAALIVTSDVSRQLSKDYKVDPRRAATITGVFACVVQGLLPYGNQILLISALAESTVAPIEIVPHMWYVIFLGITTIISIYIPYADKSIEQDPWDWNYDAPKSRINYETGEVDSAGF